LPQPKDRISASLAQSRFRGRANNWNGRTTQSPERSAFVRPGNSSSRARPPGFMDRGERGRCRFAGFDVRMTPGSRVKKSSGWIVAIRACGNVHCRAVESN